MEINLSDEILKQFGIDIKDTILGEILSIPTEKLIEPKMKIGPEPDHKIKGSMTQFEKQCFTAFYQEYKHCQIIIHKNTVGKLNGLLQKEEKYFELAQAETNDRKTKHDKFFIKNQSMLTEMIQVMQEKDASQKVETLQAILRETIKSRLNLNRGDNVRYYVSVGWQIISESGIKDREEQVFDERNKVTNIEMDQMLSLKWEDDDGKQQYKNSAYSEKICVLF